MLVLTGDASFLCDHGAAVLVVPSQDWVTIEGIAVLVLKRLADAERDGDRIYAVIKSVAGSSDGRDKGLTAPRPEGQALALERAYAKAGFSPATVSLIEAHGTGTVAGDQADAEAPLRRDGVGPGDVPGRLGPAGRGGGHRRLRAGTPRHPRRSRGRAPRGVSE